MLTAGAWRLCILDQGQARTPGQENSEYFELASRHGGGAFCPAGVRSIAVMADCLWQARWQRGPAAAPLRRNRGRRLFGVTRAPNRAHEKEGRLAF